VLFNTAARRVNDAGSLTRKSQVGVGFVHDSKDKSNLVLITNKLSSSVDQVTDSRQVITIIEISRQTLENRDRFVDMRDSQVAFDPAKITIDFNIGYPSELWVRLQKSSRQQILTDHFAKIRLRVFPFFQNKPPQVKGILTSRLLNRHAQKQLGNIGNQLGQMSAELIAMLNDLIGRMNNQRECLSNHVMIALLYIDQMIQMLAQKRRKRPAGIPVADRFETIVLPQEYARQPIALGTIPGRGGTRIDIAGHDLRIPFSNAFRQ
jgi:glutaredoxin-related protein